MIKNKPIVVFVGTYPPRECGIATFTKDLFNSSRQFLGKHISCKIVAVNMSLLDNHVYPPEVAWQINQDNKREYLELAKKFNNNAMISGVVVEHEFGIYGGKEGENILSFIENCKKPVLVTMHTVLPTPNAKMKEVTARIIKGTDIIVVLTERSREILEDIYPFSRGKVYVIPHGVHSTEFASTEKAKKKLKLKNSSIILSTFGLLSRGKGIEYVIESLPQVIKKYPSLLYLVIGGTHPVVRRNEGERYRLELADLVTKLGLKKHVKFYDQYLSLADLIEFLKATDIYISTSINPDQAVSGTLSYALGTGRAVISTNFAQAKEIITDDLGRLVPVKDSPAMSLAMLDLLSSKKELKKMHKSAYDATRSMLWSNVAKEYSDLLTRVVLPVVDLRYLKKMTDDFGLFQFGVMDTPNKDFGYTLDDNARALIVCNRLVQHHPPRGINILISIYLDFIGKCQQPDGTFLNYIGYEDKKPTSQNNHEDLSDAASRAMWALSEIMANHHLPESMRTKAQDIFLRALPHVSNFNYLRSKAFFLKSLVIAMDAVPDENKKMLDLIVQISKSLVLALKANSNESWEWFEDYLGYNNALLPETLLLAGSLLKKEEYIQLGISSLQFLIDQTFTSNMYLPIGHSDWYKRDGKRSNFDQQPEDPASMIIALETAYRITGLERYKNLANKCFSWFLGNNSLHQPLYNYETGGCHDGLHPDRVNQNQGAESLISYLLARLAMDEINKK